MVADATNFINKNIQKFNPTRTSSAPAAISIKGVSVIFCKKEKIKKRTRIHLEKIEQVKPKIIENQKQKKLKTDKPYCGIRRTSIRSKEKIEIKPPEPKIKKPRWLPKREALSLPVTKIPAPEPHPTNFGLFLKLAEKTWSRNRASEALDKHPTTLDRLLAAMEASIRQNQSVEDGHNHPTKSDLETDNSYERVYQRHVDTLNSVISQNPTPASADVKRKRKGPPKLEIKIAPTDQYFNTITQNLEELNFSEKVDNCGDLTPVITFNHVSTVSTPDEFQYRAISPGTSSKGSRSPSPLLEVPQLVGEISTKFPTV